jgi:hypothetical protein
MDGLWSRLVTAAEISTATPNLTQELAKRLTAQLIQHHGCCSDCHRQAQEEYETERKQHWDLHQSQQMTLTVNLSDVD